jgi:hypothetical protein
MPMPTTPRIALLLALTATLSPALATDATATAASTFTLNRGETVTQVCARLQGAGATLSTPDCVREILFANRDWFNDRFGYVWENPASVRLDSAVRLWAGVAYVLPAGLVVGEPAPAEPVAEAPQATGPIHPGHFDPKGKPPSEHTKEDPRRSSAYAAVRRHPGLRREQEGLHRADEAAPDHGRRRPCRLGHGCLQLHR